MVLMHTHIKEIYHDILFVIVNINHPYMIVMGKLFEGI